MHKVKVAGVTAIQKNKMYKINKNAPEIIFLNFRTQYATQPKFKFKKIIDNRISSFSQPQHNDRRKLQHNDRRKRQKAWV